MARYEREFLALPVMGAGMTATQVTPGLGTWVRDSPEAGRRAGTLAEGFPGSPAPIGHGPGSQARRAQGQEGLGVSCLCLCGDRQAVGHHPSSQSHHPEPHAVANTCARPGHRGEFPGQPLPPGEAGGSPHTPCLWELVEGVWREAAMGESPASVQV